MVAVERFGLGATGRSGVAMSQPATAEELRTRLLIEEALGESPLGPLLVSRSLLGVALIEVQPDGSVGHGVCLTRPGADSRVPKPLADLPDRVLWLVRLAAEKGVCCADLAHMAWASWRVAWLRDLTPGQMEILRQRLEPQPSKVPQPVQEAKPRRTCSDGGRGDLDLCGDRRPPSVATSETSREAAADLSPDLVAKARAAVYRYLENRGAQGATDEEMQLGIPMAANTQRPRRRELEQSGLVIDSEQRRETKSGRRAVVWALRSAMEVV